MSGRKIRNKATLRKMLHFQHAGGNIEDFEKDKDKNFKKGNWITLDGIYRKCIFHLVEDQFHQLLAYDIGYDIINHCRLEPNETFILSVTDEILNPLCNIRLSTKEEIELCHKQN